MGTGQIKEGVKAPPFTAVAAGGRRVSLRDYRGKAVVLYFYPRDNTPGCTREACEFRDSLPRMRRRGAVVLAVSKDSLESHDRFRDKYGLNFPLLSDPDGKIIAAYGAWKKKTMFGKQKMGIERSTFLIDGRGVIRRIWRRVKVDGHAEEVLNAIRTL